MNDEFDKSIEEFLLYFRTLQLTRIYEIIDEITNKIGDGNLDPKYVKRISSVVFPIFYPSDNYTSKLRFTIICVTCSFLVRFAPETRLEILESIIDTFKQFPNAFVGKEQMKKLTIDFFKFSPNYWEVLQEVFKNYTNDLKWSFLLYAGNKTVLLSIENWNYILELISESSFFLNRQLHEIVDFLIEVTDKWGSNPIVASKFTDYCLNLDSLNDLPSFLFDQNAHPQTFTDKIIYLITKNCANNSQKTARVLSGIMRNDEKYKSILFKLSLFIALMLNVSQNYRNPILQRVKTIVENNKFDPIVAAHITIAASMYNSQKLSFLDIFYNSFSGNSILLSTYFGKFNECIDCLPIPKTIPSLLDGLKSIVNGSPSQSICDFCSSLLCKIIQFPDCFIQEDLQPLKQYIDIILAVTFNYCVLNISTISFKLLLSIANIIVMLESLFSINIKPQFDLKNIVKCYFVCAIYAKSLHYSKDGKISIPFEYAFTARILSILLGFSNLIKSFSDIMIVYKLDSFYPKEFSISDELAKLIYEGAKISQKDELCAPTDFYKTIIFFLEMINNLIIIKKFIQKFWNNKNSLSMPMNLFQNFINLLIKNNCYDLCKSYFIYLIDDNNNELLNELKQTFQNKTFRYWFVKNILAPSAMKLPQAYYLARKLRLDIVENEFMLRGLSKVLPYTIPSALRAEAMKYVATSEFISKPILNYCLDVSLSILLQNPEKPIFPTFDDIIYDNNIEINSILNSFVVNNKSALSLEIEASLYILGKNLQKDRNFISDEKLDKIHKSLFRSQDPRIKKPYLKFLSSIGLRGIPYASSISDQIQVIPFY